MENELAPLELVISVRAYPCPNSGDLQFGDYMYYSDYMHIIPKDIRQYLRMRGDIYGIYLILAGVLMADTEKVHQRSATVANVYMKYPSWQDVVETTTKLFGKFPDDWSIENHEQFYRALSWFKEWNADITWWFWYDE